MEKPIELVWAGEFISPERGWKHLTRTLIEYELMIVTEGELFIADEQEEYRVQAGEYLIMPPTRFQHGTQECKCRFFWLHFNGASRPASLSLPAHGKYTDGEKISEIMKLLFQAEMRQQRGIQSHYLTSVLLAELAAQAHVEFTAEAEPDARRALCEKVKSYAHWQRFSNLRVSDLARELGYHEKYLSTVFRETEGITLKRYLTNRRMTEARRLLLETDFTVAEVGYYLNFESPHNFCRAFKADAGVTPSEFRNQTRQTE